MGHRQPVPVLSRRAVAGAWETSSEPSRLQAQGKDDEAAEAQLQLGDHVFEVRDKSSGMFAFSLVDGAFEIRLSSSQVQEAAYGLRTGP